MAVEVAFCRVGNLGGRRGIGIIGVRKRERIALDGTTTTTALDGEMIVVGNQETDMIRIAAGTTPDADATTENGAVTTAGYPLGSGMVSDPIVAVAGMKINAKAAD